MKVYQNFIGIDIGKYSFVVSVFGQKGFSEHENNSAGIAEFLEIYNKLLPQALCVLEATGGYELAYPLCIG